MKKLVSKLSSNPHSKGSNFDTLSLKNELHDKSLKHKQELFDLCSTQ